MLAFDAQNDKWLEFFFVYVYVCVAYFSLTISNLTVFDWKKNKKKQKKISKFFRLKKQQKENGWKKMIKNENLLILAIKDWHTFDLF